MSTMAEGKPWQDEKWLRQKTIDEGINSNQLAKEYDITPKGIRYWMKKYDIPRGAHNKISASEEELRKLYWEKGLSQRQMAEKFGCSEQGVAAKMNRLEMELRSRSKRNSLFHGGDGSGVNYMMDDRGHMYWSVNEDDTVRRMAVHRLLAVAEHGVEALKDRHVHHANYCAWDNRPDNIVVMDGCEHLSYHAHRREGDRDKPWIECDDYDGFSKEDISVDPPSDYNNKRNTNQ